MKKLLFAVFAFILLTSVTYGQSASDIQAQIQALLKQIQVLQAQLQTLRATQPTVATPTPTPAAKYNFSRELNYGNRNEDVKQLQEFLIDEGFLAKNLNTSYFGRLTQQALTNYQKSVGLSATGSFDSKAKEYVNKFLTETAVTAPATTTTTTVTAPVAPTATTAAAPTSTTTPAVAPTPATTTTPTATTTPVTTQPVSITSNDWVFVFTNRGTPMPSEAVNFICNTAKPSVVSWLEREANKYQKTKPFTNIVCLTDQVLLSGDLLNGGSMTAEGATITNPLNDAAVINFLQNQNSSFINVKYVTVFHYLPSWATSAPHAHNNKYDFIFVTRVNDYTPFYPELSINNYGEKITHEFMHKLGATDKYGVTAQQACLTNPATGQQYNGYDIMCHRVVYDTPNTYIQPAFLDLIVTEPTAAEINWAAIPALAVVSPNGGEQWVRGSTQTIRWSANPNVIASVIINLVRDSNNDGVYEPATQISSSTASSGQYNWQIPDIPSMLPAANDYRIQIWSYASTINDLSDAPFSIVSTPTSTPTSPPSTVPSPTALLSASTSSITSGQSTIISWTCGNSTSASINQGIGSVATAGNQSVSPTSSTTYTLTCTNSAGVTATATATVNVSAPAPQLSVDLKINGSDNPLVSFNSVITASWQSTGAVSCYAFGSNIPLTEGGSWGDLYNLPASGVKTLYARHASSSGYVSSLMPGIGCSSASGASVNDSVTISIASPGSFESNKYSQYASILSVMRKVLEKMAEIQKLK